MIRPRPVEPHIREQYGCMPTRYHTRHRLKSTGSRAATRSNRQDNERTTHVHQTRRATHAPPQGAAIRPSDETNQPHQLLTTIPCQIFTLTRSRLSLDTHLTPYRRVATTDIRFAATPKSRTSSPRAAVNLPSKHAAHTVSPCAQAAANRPTIRQGTCSIRRI